jgi:transcriptional regulator of acetoin/glycerol metabolism
MRDADKAWKRFVQQIVELPPAIPERPYILESWKRCSDAGLGQALDNNISLRRVEPSELKVRLDGNQDLVNTAGPLLVGFSAALGTLRHVVYLTDRDEIVLFSVGDRDSKLVYGLLPGFDWSEQTMGTNGAGTAIATNRPVAVIGPDHYQLPFRDATCLAAPIHSPRGELIGAVDLSTHVNNAEISQLT